MPLREQLERLVDDMVTRGVRYEDAQREFEKRFIAHVLQDADGNLGKAADLLGMHRNTLSRKIAEYRLRRSACPVLTLGSTRHYNWQLTRESASHHRQSPVDPRVNSAGSNTRRSRVSIRGASPRTLQTQSGVERT